MPEITEAGVGSRDEEDLGTGNVRLPVEEDPNKSSINWSFSTEKYNCPLAAEGCAS